MNGTSFGRSTRNPDRQQLPPSHESRPQNEGDTGRVVRAPGPDIALDAARQLLSEQQVLGREPRVGLERQFEQPQQVVSRGVPFGSRAAIIPFQPGRLANAQKRDGIEFLRNATHTRSRNPAKTPIVWYSYTFVHAASTSARTPRKVGGS